MLTLCPGGGRRGALRRCVILAAPWLLAPAADAADPGAIVFNELMWAGSAASSADEWIELYNRSAQPVDLAGWTIARVDGEEEEAMLVVGEGSVRPGGVFLIANYSHEDSRSLLASAPQVVDAAVSLPNSRLHLRLYDGPPGSARLVDEADDGTGSPFGGQGGDARASMVRLAVDGPGGAAASWGTAAEAAGWDPGASEMGTPGLASTSLPSGSDGATLVSPVSWASLKGGR